MSHYDPRDHEVSLRCDGDHSWGKEYLDTSSTDLVLEDGNVCLKIRWRIAQGCTKEYTNNVKSSKRTCQAMNTVETNSIVIPVERLEELSTDSDKE